MYIMNIQTGRKYIAGSLEVAGTMCQWINFSIDKDVIVCSDDDRVIGVYRYIRAASWWRFYPLGG